MYEIKPLQEKVNITEWPKCMYEIRPYYDDNTVTVCGRASASLSKATNSEVYKINFSIFFYPILQIDCVLALHTRKLEKTFFLFQSF
jgi:hypothetical protein